MHIYIHTITSITRCGSGPTNIPKIAFTFLITFILDVPSRCVMKNHLKFSCFPEKL